MFGLPNILIESFVEIVFIPIWFNIYSPHLSLGLSFLFNSPNFLKYETPSAFAAIKKITKNSSIALLLSSDGQLIDFNFFGLTTFISAISSPLYFFLFW